MNKTLSVITRAAFHLDGDAAQFRHFNSAEMLFQLNVSDDRPLLAWMGTCKLA